MTFHLTEKDRVAYGLKYEELLQEELENFFEIKLWKSKDKYQFYDFYNPEKKVFIELKSRTNRINDYPTSYCSKSKFLKADPYIKKGHKFFVVFNYLDSLSYFRYENQTFDEELIKGCGNNPPQLKYLIPLQILKEIKHQQLPDPYVFLHGYPECLF